MVLEPEISLNPAKMKYIVDSASFSMQMDANIYQNSLWKKICMWIFIFKVFKWVFSICSRHSYIWIISILARRENIWYFITRISLVIGDHSFISVYNWRFDINVITDWMVKDIMGNREMLLLGVYCQLTNFQE